MAQLHSQIAFTNRNMIAFTFKNIKWLHRFWGAQPVSFTRRSQHQTPGDTGSPVQASAEVSKLQKLSKWQSQPTYISQSQTINGLGLKKIQSAAWGALQMLLWGSPHPQELVADICEERTASAPIKTIWFWGSHHCISPSLSLKWTNKHWYLYTIFSCLGLLILLYFQGVYMDRFFLRLKEAFAINKEFWLSRTATFQVDLAMVWSGHTLWLANSPTEAS